jgi:sulfatase modifying factor 1
MNTRSAQPHNGGLSPIQYTVIAGLGFCIGLSIFVGVVAFGDRIIRLGLAGNAFYITLLPLGLATAAFLFGAMNSAASFSGKVLSGYLKLSGPIVGAAIVVAGGFYLADPSAVPFAVTVRVQGPGGPGSAVSTGRVIMELGRSLPESELNSRGEAEFKEIPPSYRGAKVRFFLTSPGFELADPETSYNLSDGLIIVKTKSLRQSGVDYNLKNEIKSLVVLPENEARPDMLRVTHGTFVMGSPNTEGDRESEEVQHRVNISHDFLASSTVITQSQFKKVTGSEPVLSRKTGIGRLCRDMGVGDNYPIVCITWFEAIEYCNKLSDLEELQPAYEIQPDGVIWHKDSSGYRLPTEAEWEEAARGGTTSAYWAGSSYEAVAEVAWVKENAGHGAHPVATKKPNPFGLFDVHGNTWQMVWDIYADYPTGEVTDPAGPETSGKEALRVWRGGSWFATYLLARSAYRYRFLPSMEFGDAGFRIVRTVAQ